MQEIGWAQLDLNQQPTDYESAALTKLSYGPQNSNHRLGHIQAAINRDGGSGNITSLRR